MTMLSSIHNVEYVRLGKITPVKTENPDREFFTRELTIDTKEGLTLNLSLLSNHTDCLTVIVEPDGKPTRA